MMANRPTRILADWAPPTSKETREKKVEARVPPMAAAGEPVSPTATDGARVSAGERVWPKAAAGAAVAGSVAALVAFGSAAEGPAFLLIGAAGGYLASKWRGISRQMAQLREDLADREGLLAQSGKLSAAGELAVGLAHELRHPVASLKGIASLLREPNLNAGIREECVSILGRECERIERLLSELLRFARPRHPEESTVKAEELAEAAIGLVRYTTEGKPVEFQTEICAGLGEIRCDREQVKQVLVNLLLNAIHAMPEGGVVAVRAKERNGAAVMEVVDEGRGVPPELMDKIFLPFVTTRAEGTGLGLSVAKQIVTQHGGELTAVRNRGRGMTFRFELPLNGGGGAP